MLKKSDLILVFLIIFCQIVYSFGELDKNGANVCSMTLFNNREKPTLYYCCDGYEEINNNCETPCVEGKYGWACSHRCDCEDEFTSQCNKTNGECECKPDHWGARCHCTVDLKCADRNCTCDSETCVCQEVKEIIEVKKDQTNVDSFENHWFYFKQYKANVGLGVLGFIVCYWIFYRNKSKKPDVRYSMNRVGENGQIKNIVNL